MSDNNNNTIISIPFKLLKHFIDLAISYKEFSVISIEHGKQIEELDPFEEHFHCEFINNDLCKIYRIKDWRENTARLEAIKRQSEIERAERFRREEIIDKAKLRLMNKTVNPLTAREADNLIINILSGDQEIYGDIGRKLGLAEFMPASSNNNI